MRTIFLKSLTCWQPVEVADWDHVQFGCPLNGQPPSAQRSSSYPRKKNTKTNSMQWVNTSIREPFKWKEINCFAQTYRFEETRNLKLKVLLCFWNYRGKTIKPDLYKWFLKQSTQDVNTIFLLGLPVENARYNFGFVFFLPADAKRSFWQLARQKLANHRAGST